MSPPPTSQDQQTPTDSGYGSGQPVPETRGDLKKRQSILAYPQRGFALTRPTLVELSIFSKDTDQRSSRRFRAIQGPTEKLLRNHLLGKKKITPRQWREANISSRLLVLGNCKADATENVVVFCPPWMCKAARQFYDKDKTVKDILSPSDGIGPSFSIVVADGFATVSRCPEIGVLGAEVEASDQTRCGQQIYFTNENGSVAQATFGGTVKVIRADGTIDLYGLTAGHSLHEWVALDDRSNEEDPSFESDADSCGDSSTNSENYSISRYIAEVEGTFPTKGPVEISIPHDATKIAKVYHVSTNGSGGYFDWALIEVEKGLPNLVVADGGDGQTANKPINVDLFEPSPVSDAFGPQSMQRDVILNTQTQGPREGKLSGTMGRVKIGPGEAFTDAYMVTLKDGPVSHGTSGAWVVESTTLRILGHVVATDITGDAYVLPMGDILDDICSDLGAQKVTVASELDFQHRHIDPELSRDGSTLFDRARVEVKREALLHSSTSCTTIEPPLCPTPPISGEINWKNPPNQSVADASGNAIGSSPSSARVPGMAAQLGKRPWDDEARNSRDEEEVAPSKRPRPAALASQDSGSPLACPFYKRFPLEHRRCYQFKFSTIHRIKHHLKKAHMQSPNCVRCLRTFENDVKLSQHHRDSICERRLGPPMESMGMTNFQKDQLMIRSRERNRVKQWYMVYDILFPDAQTPASPWSTWSRTSSEVDNFVDQVEMEGPRIILELLENAGGLLQQRATLSSSLHSAIVQAMQQIRSEWDSSLSVAGASSLTTASLRGSLPSMGSSAFTLSHPSASSNAEPSLVTDSTSSVAQEWGLPWDTMPPPTITNEHRLPVFEPIYTSFLSAWEGPVGNLFDDTGSNYDADINLEWEPEKEDIPVAQATIPQTHCEDEMRFPPEGRGE